MNAWRLRSVLFDFLNDSLFCCEGQLKLTDLWCFASSFVSIEKKKNISVSRDHYVRLWNVSRSIYLSTFLRIIWFVKQKETLTAVRTGRHIFFLFWLPTTHILWASSNVEDICMVPSISWHPDGVQFQVCSLLKMWIEKNTHKNQTYSVSSKSAFIANVNRESKQTNKQTSHFIFIKCI